MKIQAQLLLLGATSAFVWGGGKRRSQLRPESDR
jgi:hypothetical protein